MGESRVLHYAPSLDRPGGLRSYVLSMVAEQRAREFDVAVASPTDAGAPEGMVASLADAVRAVRPDVVHLHGGHVLPDLDDDHLRGVPVVSTVHGHGLYCPAGTKWSPSLGACSIAPSAAACTWHMLKDQCGSRRPQKIADNLRSYRDLRRQRASHHQHCVSRWVEERLHASGYATGRSSVIYAPVPALEQREDDHGLGHFDLLLAGRARPNKGLDVAIRALAASTLQPRMAVLGDGEEMRGLQDLARSLGVAGRVSFLGWRDRSVLEQLHTARTLLLVPSQWPEPAGLVAMEAASRGRVALVSDRGGLPEFVPDDDQVVSDAADPSAWAQAIDRALAAPAWLERRGAEARDLWAARFAPDAVLPRFAELYAEVSGL